MPERSGFPMSDAGVLADGDRSLRRQPLLAMLSDDRLVRMAAEGSSAAFSVIYRRYHQPLYRYCRSILGDEHEAADALQSAMLRAMRALEGERREIALKPWLFRIAHNEAISVVRRRRPDQPLEHAADVAATEADPETRQRLRDLIADLDRLVPRQRSALVMRELNGLSFEEIAAVLDTTPNAVKTTVYEARQALNEIEAGRDMPCEEIRMKLSDGDRRMLRGRAVRAHLAACADCECFAHELRKRPARLAAIAPPLPAPAAAAILASLFGGGGSGGVAALAGGSAAGLGAGAALKLGAAGVLAIGVGTVAIETGGGGEPEPAAAERPPAALSSELANSPVAPPVAGSESPAASGSAGGRGHGNADGGKDGGRGHGGSNGHGHGNGASTATVTAMAPRTATDRRRRQRSKMRPRASAVHRPGRARLRPDRAGPSRPRREERPPARAARLRDRHRLRRDRLKLRRGRLSLHPDRHRPRPDRRRRRPARPRRLPGRSSSSRYLLTLR